MATYKTGAYAIATTNRAPLVRGRAYRILEVLQDRFTVNLRLEDIPFVESAVFFRPATELEAQEAAERDELTRQMELPLRLHAGDGPGNEPTIFPLPEPSAAPDGNPKTRFGMAKPPLSLIPGSARVHLATAFRDGAKKYGPANWRVDPVTGSTYLNACERHLVAWQDGEDFAEDSGVHHLAHAAACLLIILDAEASGTLNDDRPPVGATAALIKAMTLPMT